MSAPFIPQFFKDPLDASSPYWDYVICNETEAEAYARSHGLETLADASDIRAIARAIAASPAFSIAGGGDTLAAIAKYGIEDQVGYISTGGGAFLEILEGKTLPAFEILARRAGG